MFGRKKKDKYLSYQIVGHNGIRDGAILEPNQSFSRSWTVLNSSPALSKEKGKIVKLVYIKGLNLKPQLLFLWPVPGKIVTISLDLIAPSEPGKYECFWSFEGLNEPEFWVKFSVSALPPKRNSNPSTPSPHKEVKITKTRTKKRMSEDDKKPKKSKKKNILKSSIETKKKASSVFVNDSILNKSSKKKKRRNKRSSSIASESANDVILPQFHGDVRSSYEIMDNIFDNDTKNEKSESKLTNILQESTEKSESIEETNHNSISSETKNKTNGEIDDSTTKLRTLHKLRKKDIRCTRSLGKTEASYLDKAIKNELSRKSLVEKWQESVTNLSSSDLTNLQKQKIEKIEQIKIETPSIIKNKLLSTTDAPMVRKSSPIEMLRPSKRLTISTISPISTRRVSLSNIQDSLNIYTKMSRDIHLNLIKVSSEYSSDNELVLQLKESQKTIKHLISSIEKTVEQIKITEERISGNKLICNLPESLWKYIFSYLSFKDLLKLSSVCKDWNKLTNNNSLWEKQLKQIHQSETLNFCTFANKFTNKHLLQLEYQYGDWFNCELWEYEESKSLSDFSFNWPVYDLQIVDSTLVTVSDCLRVFDINKNKSVATLAGHEKVVNSVKLTANAKACITGSVDKTVKLWSLTTKECWTTLEGHTGPITDVHQSSDLIISCCVSDKSVKFWQKTTGECIYTIEFPNQVSRLAMNLTESSNYIYFGHSNGIVTTWDIETQQEIQNIKVTDKCIEGLQVFDKQCIISDFSQIYIQDFNSKKYHSSSDVMTRNVGKIQFDGFKLGAQIGNKLQIFDIRYLFSNYSHITVDNLWKGAFQFNEDYIYIGGGNGKTKKWYPK